ncbi:hypothetical protein DOTSEDRAFT_71384 [Dothistroma septosporum NZE10]|uniref:Uncharacterized protein n=1 Tax=Dothistroma septosporum (strain NZE10 / CBS 128990) TaxID=675120 RepID=N1PTI6_DOTSN|nr:hypothetical protein DOTSEDRAFT_71384 [Dothistroma septosporum NZE10]
MSIGEPFGQPGLVFAHGTVVQGCRQRMDLGVSRVTGIMIYNSKPYTYADHRQSIMGRPITSLDPAQRTTISTAQYPCPMLRSLADNSGPSTLLGNAATFWY